MAITTFDHIVGEGISPQGDPYVVAIGIDPSGQRHPLLACSRQVDLTILPMLEGMQVALRETPNGVQLLPLEQQPVEVQRHVAARLVRANPGVGRYERATEMLTQLISAVAEQANRLKIPAAAWVFVPAVD